MSPNYEGFMSDVVCKQELRNMLPVILLQIKD